jgi:hypothetical protein
MILQVIFMILTLFVLGFALQSAIVGVFAERQLEDAKKDQEPDTEKQVLLECAQNVFRRRMRAITGGEGDSLMVVKLT